MLTSGLPKSVQWVSLHLSFLASGVAAQLDQKVFLETLAYIGVYWVIYKYSTSFPIKNSSAVEANISRTWTLRVYLEWTSSCICLQISKNNALKEICNVYVFACVSICDLNFCITNSSNFISSFFVRTMQD